MFPNGMPGSHPKSFKNSIPIRIIAAGLSDGIGESIGRFRGFRRETHKVRSPPLIPRSDNSKSGLVPLEFDEEDEDFLTQNTLGTGEGDDTFSRTASQGGHDSGASGSTPATSAHPLEDDDGGEGDDMWQGWGPENKEAIEEAERFDDISAMGFLDEEHTMMAQAADKRK